MQSFKRLTLGLGASLPALLLATASLAAPGESLVIDAANPGSTSCPGGTVLGGGVECEYSGTHTFDDISLTNGAIVSVVAFDNDESNKGALGNLVLRSLSTITVDATSRISAKGAGYQPALCDNGPGPAAFPLSGGRGGCAVQDSGGGGGHFGPGGKGTKDCFIFGSATTCTFPEEWEEACGHLDPSGPSCVDDDQGGEVCWGSTDDDTDTRGDALPGVAGQAFWHHILETEFGAAGGDKGCRDGYDNRLRSGGGGGRVVLFAANDSQDGLVTIAGRVVADGERGCAAGNDSAGGGAGGTILIVGDRVELAPTARITAHGGRGGDSQPKCLPCSNPGVQDICEDGQLCTAFVEPASGASYNLCSPCNCTPCTSDAECSFFPGLTCKDLGGELGHVCADASDACTPYDVGDDEGECQGTQNNGVCDDCAGGGGGGIINVQSRTASIDPRAIFDVRGAPGGICPICAGEAGGGAGELQIDSAYVGEVCDGRDNDFDGGVDEGLADLSCPEGTTVAACALDGTPNSCVEVSSCNGPVTDTRPRFALVLDTSGSMLLNQAGYPTFGDGSAEFPGVHFSGDTSRLYTAKSALADVLAAFPESDYALARYYQDTGVDRSCQTASWFECASSCCSYDDPLNNETPAYPDYYPGNQCVLADIYASATGPAQAPVDVLTDNISIGWSTPSQDCINYAGSCGPPERGAQFLVDFGSPLGDYLAWLDHAETDFRSDLQCVAGDCELRATGPTPLGSSLEAASAYLEPRIQCDAAAPCRKYSVILLTDGAESCQGDPVAAATTLSAGVLRGSDLITIDTYVIGFSVLDAERQQLNDIAQAGGTEQAYFVDNRDALANALATIVSTSFGFETCNRADDDCDGEVDEDFPEVGQPCDDGLLGICRGTGQYDCSASGGTECVIDDPGASARAEECNGLDDDCDGAIDEGISCTVCIPLPETCNGRDDDCDDEVDEVDDLVDVGSPCGLALGVCEQGSTTCQAGTLVCDGATGPSVEVCNGLDDNCDGVTDGMTQACYTAEAATLGEGVCRAGVSECVAEEGSNSEAWDACIGQVTPSAEVCDGLDNDCDGETDEGVDDGHGQVTGDTCCPPGVNCDVGQCSSGTLVCAGSQVVCTGAVGPTAEACDGVDNDCNGEIDDLSTVGSPCIAGGCAGVFECDPELGELVCQRSGTANPEVCDGVDNDCDGEIDEEPDVSSNDDRIGSECDAPEAPNDQPPCQAGINACVDGTVRCQGAVGPSDETCDGVDNDCDGRADWPSACPVDGDICRDGACLSPCDPGEIPCPGGYVCQRGACAPSLCFGVTCPEGEVCEAGECVAGTEPGAGGASATAGGAAGNGNAQPGGSGAGGGDAEQAGAAGSSSSSAGAAASDSRGSAGADTAEGDPESRRGYGLTTGGGGCSCSLGSERRSAPEWALLLCGVGVALLRRRRRALASRQEVTR